MTRQQLIGVLLDRMARDMAEDIIKHSFTERECVQITADLANEAISYAVKFMEEEEADQ